MKAVWQGKNLILGESTITEEIKSLSEWCQFLQDNPELLEGFTIAEAHLAEWRKEGNVFIMEHIDAPWNIVAFHRATDCFVVEYCIHQENGPPTTRKEKIHPEHLVPMLEQEWGVMSSTAAKLLLSDCIRVKEMCEHNDFYHWSKQLGIKLDSLKYRLPHGIVVHHTDVDTLACYRRCYCITEVAHHLVHTWSRNQ